MNSGYIFHQLFEAETSTYTYVIADLATKEAAIIDPVFEMLERDLRLINELGLNLKYVLDTHIHADHITGASELRKRTGAKTCVSKDANVECVDISLQDQSELNLGSKKIKVLATPGHTNTCLSYLFENLIFTGDSLMIRTCGRTDFQQGSSDKMFSSVRETLFQLPDDTMIYPGHDYKGYTSSNIGTEKKFNSRLRTSISKDEFKKIMSELKLAPPKKIQQAVPANLVCGDIGGQQMLKYKTVNGIPEVEPEVLRQNLRLVENKKILLVDVRRADEFTGELGHIENALLRTLGPELENFLSGTDKDTEIIFVCRSGARSGQATSESLRIGFKKVANLKGGMILWNQLSLPISRS